MWDSMPHSHSEHLSNEKVKLLSRQLRKGM